MIADLLVTDARVVTVDPDLPRAAWLAVNAGRITALGTDAGDVPEARRTLSLDGATVVPGFHDAHSHTVLYGQSLTHLDLRSPGVSSLEELYRVVGEAASRQPAGTWLVGANYDQNKLRGHPRLEELDRVAPGHLVRLGHNSRHMCFVNSRVIRELRIEDEADPTGGRVERGADGRPTGLLLENAMELLRPLTWPVPVEEMVAAIGAAHQRYLSEGLTATQEAGVGRGLSGSSPVEAYAFQLARERGLLPVRTTLMPVHTGAEALTGRPEDGAFGFGMGMRSGFGDPSLRIGPMKVFSDGSLIGRSAAMHDGYADEPCNHGMLALDPEQLADTLLAAHTGGWQIATHAIGDQAVDTVLDAYARCLERVPRSDHRHRIEHAGVVSDASLARMVALGVVPSPQGRFIGEIGDGMIRALGADRVRECYRSRSFLDAGIELPASSDRPVVDGAPLLGLHDMVNRRTDSGAELSLHEGLTGAQALRAYTYGSAHATFLENDMGSLSPGRLADLTVLSDDPTSIDPARIRDIEVLTTVVGGSVAFDRSGRSD